MAEIYKKWINNGDISLDKVPPKWRCEVEGLLKDSEE